MSTETDFFCALVLVRPCGPAAMASFPTVKSTQRTSSFGTSPRFNVPKSARLTPGPGTYGTGSYGSGITSSQYASSLSPHWNSRTSTPVLRKSPTSDYMAQGSSFGQQCTSVRSSASASALHARTPRRQRNTDENPGPGAYSYSSSFSRSAEKRNGVGSSFGGSQDLGRLDTWAGLSPEQKTPGPHQAGFAACGGGHVLSDWQSGGPSNVASPAPPGRGGASPTCPLAASTLLCRLGCAAHASLGFVPPWQGLGHASLGLTSLGKAWPPRRLKGVPYDPSLSGFEMRTSPPTRVF